MDVVGYLLHYCVEIKDKPRELHAQPHHEAPTDLYPDLHGMCRAISYIIQSLSAEAAFGAKLTDPVKVPVPTSWNGIYNAGDFLIHVRSRVRSYTCCYWMLTFSRPFTPS